MKLASPALRVLLFALGAMAAASPATASGAWQDLPVQGGNAVVRVPTESFTLLGQSALVPAPASSPSLLWAPTWLLRNRPGATDPAATAGGPASTPNASGASWDSGLAQGLQSPVQIVLGRWSEPTAELVIDVLRLQRTPSPQGGVQVQALTSSFTPAHGGRWAAARAYLTASEALADPTRPGRNPFARFAGTDPVDAVFHDIDLAAAEVAVGHAMTHFHAAAGLLAVASVDPKVSQSTSGNWLVQTVTTTVTGTAHIDWLVALPAAAQPQAPQAAICVVATPCLDAACSRRQPCPDIALVASSRAGFDLWSGGSLPVTPETVYQWSTSQSSWNPLALAIVGGIVLSVAGFDPQAASDLASLAGSGLDASALAYALFAQPGAPAPALTAATGLPAVAGIDDGVRIPPPAPSPQQSAMNLALAARATASSAGTAGLSALRVAASGALPAPAVAGTGNAGALLGAWAAQLRACAAQGMAGAALAQCADVLVGAP